MTPQQIEAMKMALDLATMHHTDDGYAALRAKVRSASKEALAQPEQEPVISKWVLREVYFDEDGEPVMHRSPPQPEQEPAAIKRMKEWIEYLKRKSDFGQHMKIPSEMNAGTCWELALELEQFINTAPSQPEPVIDKSAAKRIATTLGWEPKRGWVGAGDLENSSAYLTPPQQEQELVAYAGVKVWVGNQQVVRCLTQTELHYAVEPWLLVELNALKCIASFKEKKT